MLTSTDVRGRVNTFVYNNNDLIQSVTNAGNKTTTFTYDVYGYLLSKNFDGLITSYEYNKLDQLLKETSPEGQFAEFTYDNFGNMLSIASEGRISTFTYDVLGRITSTYDANTDSEKLLFYSNSHLADKTEKWQRSDLRERDNG